MASNYLDLYTVQSKENAGTMYERSVTNTQRIVHDTLNNKYYGEQSKDLLTKGLEDSIARLEQQLTQRGETKYSSIMGQQRSSYYRYTAADRAKQNQALKDQKSYLNNMHNYMQEDNQFFDSYDAYTGDWNNVFKGRYDTKVMQDRNKQVLARNEKVEARNKALQSQIDNGLGIGDGSKALATKLKPNKNIKTGIQTKADQLTASLGIGRSGLGI